jgi:trehalose-phosphatase
VLMLDYDGTLAPFCKQRMEAVPYPGVLAAIRALLAARHTRTVIVSGRPVSEVAALINSDLDLEIWGAHGWERRIPGRPLERWSPSGAVATVLREAFHQVRDLVDNDALETKAASVALHTRAMSDEGRDRVADLIDRFWRPLADDAAIRLREFDGGYELRATERTKATVVDQLRSEQQESQTGSVLIAYLGDDDTDEDAFARLTGSDWPILVREQARPSHSRYWLRPPLELLRFIHTWTTSVG